MKRYLATYLTLLLFFILSSCSSGSNELITEEEYNHWFPQPVEEFEEGTLVRHSPFVAGDDATRSSFEFDGSSLIFQWEIGDALGIYSTAAKPTPIPSVSEEEEAKYNYDGLIKPTDATDTHHPDYTDALGWCFTDHSKQSQARYVCTETKNGAQTARIFSTGNGGFDWDETNRWTAYYHFNQTYGNLEQYTYKSLPFDFKNQKQIGFVNMTAYYNNETLNYRKSEFEACRHIGKADVMISPETSFTNGNRICFEMRHVGAVARFFLVVPKDKAYKLKKLQLICESKIFYESGEFSLKSHPYNSSAADGNYGLNLDASGKDGSQIKPTGEKTKMLELEFDPEKVVIDKNASDGDCLIAYIMMYPITYKQAEHGNLYAYVTAIDPDTSKEVHFVTEPLADKDMVSGRYYQWTTFADPGDGLYPIELTATLLPWQDIVGGNIDTDLTK